MSRLRERLEDGLYRAYARTEEASERAKCAAGQHDEAVTPPEGFPADSLTHVGDRLVEPGTRYCRRCRQIIQAAREV